MQTIYLIAAILMIPAFLLVSNMVVCEKPTDPEAPDSWTFDPRTNRCDAAYMTVISGIVAVLVFLILRNQFGGDSGF
jgi:hypothetical protein